MVNHSSHPLHWQLVTLFGLIVALAGVVVLSTRPDTNALDAHSDQFFEKMGTPFLENAQPGSAKEVGVKRAIARAKADMQNVHKAGETLIAGVGYLFCGVGAITMGYGLFGWAKSRANMTPR